MKAKYIVIKSGDEELIFVFPKAVVHKEMFAMVKAIKDSHGPNWSRPYFNAVCVGAGFVGNGHCYGESESLGVVSRDEVDTALLNK